MQTASNNAIPRSHGHAGCQGAVFSHLNISHVCCQPAGTHDVLVTCTCSISGHTVVTSHEYMHLSSCTGSVYLPFKYLQKNVQRRDKLLLRQGPSSAGDASWDPQWVSETVKSTKPCGDYASSYTFAPMITFNSQVRHSQRLITIT